MYSIIASWDNGNRPTSVGSAATQEGAAAKVALLVAAGHADAFAFLDQSADGQECWRVPRDWLVDPVAKTASYDPLPVVVPVPQSVSKAQGKIWLHRNGHLSNVEAMIAGGSVELQIWWADEPTWRIDNVHVVSLATALGVNLDVAFTEAARIT